jgi:tRNA pseudouridine32 synthase/23S rRNA pseudouridine746 synthase
LQLHASEIAVPLYKNRDPIRVTAPVPQHMRERLMMCGWDQASAGATRPAPLSLADATAASSARR